MTFVKSSKKQLVQINETATWGQLSAMEDNGCVLWYTPGGSTYWNSQQAFIDDFVVANPSDFVDESGIEFDRGYEVDGTYFFDKDIEYTFNNYEQMAYPCS